jgi:integrase
MSKKRGNHEGSVYRAFKNGRWLYRAAMTIGHDRNGKPKRKTFTAPTRKEAQALLTEALHKHAHGLPVAPERQTVAAYLQRWLREFKESQVRYSTQQRYKQLVARHIEPAIGRVILSKLTGMDVQTLMNAALKSGLSPRSVQYIHTTLRQALEQATKLDLVERNVASLVDPPTVPRHEITPFDQGQTLEFLKAADGHRFQFLFLLALASGLRQGELLGLRWQDVDFQAGILHVRHGLQRQKGKLVLIETKTEKSRRALPLAPIATDALKGQLAAQRRHQLAHGESWNADGFVFTSEKGTPLDATNVSHEFRKLVATTNLPQIRFHDLRHTCATLLLLQGVDMNTIKDILGHSQISLTMNTYAHVLPIMKRHAADRLNAALTRPCHEDRLLEGMKPS